MGMTDAINDGDLYGPVPVQITAHPIPAQKATADRNPWSRDCIFSAQFAHSLRFDLV
jgi:hypothetical protein